MLRAIVLSLALLIGLGTLLPLATEMAEAGPRKKRKYQKKKRKSVRKYSKRWWRLRRKRAQQRRARAQQRRARKMRRARLARKRRLARNRRARLARKRKLARNRRYSKRRRSTAAGNRRKKIISVRRVQTAEVRRKREMAAAARENAETNYVNEVASEATPQYSAPATEPKRTVASKSSASKSSASKTNVSPREKSAPKSWISKGMSQGEVQFNVQDERTGNQFGSASITVVGPAVENNRVINTRVKTVGGVATTALRRTVIDQMINEEGWVVNDYEKEVNGKKVYVVVAQAPDANNQVENRMYYFTETDGQIYRVATKAPEKNAEKLAEESEKVIDSLQSRRPAQPQIASNRAVVRNEEEND